MDKERNITLGYRMRVVSHNLLWFIIKDIYTLENARKQRIDKNQYMNISNLLTEFEGCHIFGNHKDIIASLNLILGNPGTYSSASKTIRGLNSYGPLINMIPISLSQIKCSPE